MEAIDSQLQGGPDERAHAPGDTRDAALAAAQAVWKDALSRRNFLRLMGASMALAGLSGCERSAPPAEIVPYTSAPEEIEPGQPTFFSSTMPFDGYGRGVLVLSREGRPIKIEGNPDHPDSLGAADVFMQASILDLYDPDRAKTVTEAGVDRPLHALMEMLAERLKKSDGGRGMRLLTRGVSSPTFAAQLAKFSGKFPNARWHVHDPMMQAGESALAAAGRRKPFDAIYDLSAASIIASLDCDFLFSEPGSLRYARQFSDGRRVRGNHLMMNRLYVAESTLTLSGSMADHRLPLKPAEIIAAAKALAIAVGANVPVSAPVLSASLQQWVSALAQDLRQAGTGGSVVMPGRFQPAEVHALAHAINQQLGNVGKTVSFIEPVHVQGARPLADLVTDMRDGAVETLLILEGNPAYDAPADSGFADALAGMTKAVSGDRYRALTVHLGTHFNETSYRCQWHVPMSHWLESWGDARAFDGTASLIQPLIAPLYQSVSPWEFFDGVLGRAPCGGYEILREYWKPRVSGDFDQWWVTTLQKGVIAGSASKPLATAATQAIGLSLNNPAAPATPAPMKPGGKTVDWVFRPDPSLWCGDFANNAWLQELPKPFTKLTWDNAIAVSPHLALELGPPGATLRDGDVVRLALHGRTLEGPIILMPGQADGVITLWLGYGRDRGGHVLSDDGKPRGYNAYLLRTAAASWSASDVHIEATGRAVALATAQNHHAMDSAADMPGVEAFLKPEVVATLEMSAETLALRSRKLIRTVTLEQFKKNPRFMDVLAPDEKPPLLSLYPSFPKSAELQWGMVIDTTSCMGCNACVIACQAENNIPVVGKEEVMREREMHWIRIDDYFSGSGDNPTVYHQPVPCMHCENAPCEVVCPVGATTHSPEGVNEMTYNRCVGTRFCSNNCPYKVRRFNFLLYSDYSKDSRSLQYNPDVSVRSRGVMEKCTYCIQRIDRTRIEAEKESAQLRQLARAAATDDQRKRLDALADDQTRKVVDRLQTACQQSCPARAITFGNIADLASDTARLKTEPANYVLLRNLTTKPRTSYLARITNPNSSLNGHHAEGHSA